MVYGLHMKQPLITNNRLQNVNSFEFKLKHNKIITFPIALTKC